MSLYHQLFILSILLIFDHRTWATGSSILNDLPRNHWSYFLNQNKELIRDCKNHPKECNFYDFLKQDYNPNACWGYEPTCLRDHRFSSPVCADNDPELTLPEKFYETVDFGYVKRFRNALKTVCHPRDTKSHMKSKLVCNKDYEFCKGENIIIDFMNPAILTKSKRYDSDLLRYGDIMGNCKYDGYVIDKDVEFPGFLSNWSAEMKKFVEISDEETRNIRCDMTIDKPTFFMKMDSTYNMYHHFCDFFNLYATLHVNSSHPDTFSRDVFLVYWDRFMYESPFQYITNAFTNYAVNDLLQFAGQKVCFKQVIFSLPPRMLSGLFYATPFRPTCTNSGLFKAFHEFLKQRLNIYNVDPPMNYQTNREKLRITFLSRSTPFRRIENFNELANAIERNSNYEVRKVDFTMAFPFNRQIRISHLTDIFIGIHGAGLSHLLFLPPWAVLFEIHNCNDANCYKDLAAMKGITYMTWENENLVEKHKTDETDKYDNYTDEKFMNYEFDVQEFVRLVEKAAENVYNHKEYRKYITELREQRIAHNYEGFKLETERNLDQTEKRSQQYVRPDINIKDSHAEL